MLIKTIKKPLLFISKKTNAFILSTLFSLDAFAAQGANEIQIVNKLGDIVKDALQGQGALIIDAIILAGAAYGTAVTKNPAPIVCGIISCAIFHIGIKLIA